MIEEGIAWWTAGGLAALAALAGTGLAIWKSVKGEIVDEVDDHADVKSDVRVMGTVVTEMKGRIDGVEKAIENNGREIRGLTRAVGRLEGAINARIPKE